MILLIKSVIYSIFHLCRIKLPEDEEIKNFLNRHFPLCLSDEYYEIEYEEFYEWVCKNDEVHEFLMEFFEIQTRYNAMKVFVKYLSEFELIFDSNKVDLEELKSNKALHKKLNLFGISKYMFFSKEDASTSHLTSVK